MEGQNSNTTAVIVDAMFPSPDGLKMVADIPYQTNISGDNVHYLPGIKFLKNPDWKYGKRDSKTGQKEKRYIAETPQDNVERFRQELKAVFEQAVEENPDAKIKIMTFSYTGLAVRRAIQLLEPELHLVEEGRIELITVNCPMREPEGDSFIEVEQIDEYLPGYYPYRPTLLKECEENALPDQSYIKSIGNDNDYVVVKPAQWVEGATVNEKIHSVAELRERLREHAAMQALGQEGEGDKKSQYYELPFRGHLDSNRILANVLKIIKHIPKMEISRKFFEMIFGWAWVRSLAMRKSERPAYQMEFFREHTEAT